MSIMITCTHSLTHAGLKITMTENQLIMILGAAILFFLLVFLKDYRQCHEQK